MNDNQLLHYGILGMKWGVRRTPAQLARARGERQSQDSKQNSTNSSSSKSSSSSSKRSVSDLSDDELRRVVQRLQLEQQYRNLNPQKVSVGQRFAKKVLNDVIVPAATEVGKNVVREALTNASKSLTKSKKE